MGASSLTGGRACLFTRPSAGVFTCPSLESPFAQPSLESHLLDPLLEFSSLGSLWSLFYLTLWSILYWTVCWSLPVLVSLCLGLLCVCAMLNLLVLGYNLFSSVICLCDSSAFILVTDPIRLHF